MICVPENLIIEKSRRVRIGYLERCRELSAKNESGEWCFLEDDYQTIASEFPIRTRSEMNKITDGPISGCCDRADQF